MKLRLALSLCLLGSSAAQAQYVSPLLQQSQSTGALYIMDLQGTYDIIGTPDGIGNFIPRYFTSTLGGGVTASGGGTVNFLRADGTWVVPPSIIGTAYVQDYIAGTGFTAGATTSLTVTSPPSVTGGLSVFFDGIRQSQNTWTLSGGTLTFNAAIPFNVKVVEVVTGVAAGNGGVQPGTAGQVAYYASTGSVVQGTNTVSGLTIAGATVTGSFTATGLVTNADLVNQSTTVNGQACTLGSTCTISASAGTITPGTTAIASGTTNGLLYDNAGLLGNLATGNGGVLNTSATGTPSITATPVLGVPGSAIGTLGFSGSTSGSPVITPQATAGSPTLTLPNTSGTFANGATSPLVLSATTGNLTCPTCVTSSGGGAITGTSPVVVSGAGAVSVQGATGTVLTGTSGASAFSAAPSVTSLGLGGTAPATGLELYNAAVTPTANGQGAGGSSTTLGLVLQGQGSTNDVTIANKSGTQAISIPTGTVNTNFAGATSATTVTSTSLSTQGEVCNSSGGLFSTTTTGCANFVQSLATGGTASTTAAGARASSGLNIDSVTTFTNASYSAGVADRVIATGATAFTAARTVTLPAISSYNPGQMTVVVDSGGAINGANTLTVATTGSDTINGSSTVPFSAQYGGGVFYPIGLNKWGYIAASAGGGSGTVTQVTAGPCMGVGSGNAATGQNITTTGTLQLYDPCRRNLILDHINMAKALGTAQRYIEEFADGFADSTGINAGASSGYTLTTATKSITPSSTFSTISGPNTLSTSDTNIYTFRTVILAANQSNNGLTTTCVQIGGGTSGLTNAVAYIGAGAGSGSYSYSGTPVQLSVSGSTTFNVAASGNVLACGIFTAVASNDIVIGVYAPTGSRIYGTKPTGSTSYYKSATNDAGTTGTVSGYSSSSSLYDIQLVEGSSGPANMTLVSTSQTADTTVSNARGSVIIGSAVTPTWGTSMSMELTTNGGTNWTAVTPINAGVVQAGSSQTGGVMWESPDTATTSGTSWAVRVKTLTNTSPVLYGLSTAVH